MPTLAVLYLATLMIIAVTLIAIWGTVGALASVPMIIAAAGHLFMRLR